MADTFEPRFLLASLHIEAILRGTTVARRSKTLKSIKDGAGLGCIWCDTGPDNGPERGKGEACNGHSHLGLPFGTAVRG